MGALDGMGFAPKPNGAGVCKADRMPSVCVYFQVHQPYRLRRYSIFDANEHYFDGERNRHILKRVAEKCYLPATRLILELIRRHDVPAGVCGHHLATPKGCVDQAIIPDFWMQTLHHSDYWSATPTRERSNIWCEQPDETIAFMLQRREPWIAFKVLAAGAIHPRDGFRYAFENGADFICVGMFDFQVVDDVNIALGVLNAKLDRQREWFA